MSLQGNTTKERSNDRILVLEVMEGQKAKSVTGLHDPRLFTGENRLHAIMEPQCCMWSLKYDMGGIPEPLKGQFTSFSKILETAKSYYRKRNIEITEVID